MSPTSLQKTLRSGNQRPRMPRFFLRFRRCAAGFPILRTPQDAAPQALASATAGGLALVCPPDGVPIDEVFGSGRDASATDVSLVVGGPKGFAPYTAADVLRFTGTSGARDMVSVGPGIQFPPDENSIRTRSDGGDSRMTPGKGHRKTSNFEKITASTSISPGVAPKGRVGETRLRKSLHM